MLSWPPPFVIWTMLTFTVQRTEVSWHKDHGIDTNTIPDAADRIMLIYLMSLSNELHSFARCLCWESFQGYVQSTNETKQTTTSQTPRRNINLCDWCPLNRPQVDHRDPMELTGTIAYDPLLRTIHFRNDLFHFVDKSLIFPFLTTTVWMYPIFTSKLWLIALYSM